MSREGHLVRLSVIIPCYNAERWILETIESVVIQEIENMEIILVDDGSTDNSLQVVETKFPFVKTVSGKNQGASHARNKGTEMANGKFIQYLDADDLLAPQKLKEQLEILERENADVCYGDWQELEPDGMNSFKKGLIHTDKLGDEPVLDLLTSFWCPPVVYLFKRSIVEKVGGWNERLPVIQDARFALDCAMKGGRFVYSAGVKGFYRKVLGNSLSTQDTKQFIRDCYLNACEIEELWRNEGVLREAEKKALLICYDHVAKSSYKKDEITFVKACKSIKSLSKNFSLSKPWIMKILTTVFGYELGIKVAFFLRNLKLIFYSNGKRQ